MKKGLSLLIALLITVIASAQVSDPAKIKLFRFGNPENEKPGVEYPDGTKLDVSSFGEDYGETFFASNGVDRLKNWLRNNAAPCPKVGNDVRIASCVKNPSKIIGIGLNYAAHARESNQPIPSEPILFMKSPTCLSGPFDPVILPPGSEKTDWEVELAIIIGKKASYVSKEEAMNYVAGYSIMNDYSERQEQLEGTGQWTKGKSHDTFGPLGPYLVLRENVTDPQSLRLWLTVNGEKLQDSNTSDMVFGVKEIVSAVSHHMTLNPGDVIATGTPSGVGLGLRPQRYLKEGDVVELGIDGMGVQKQKAISYVEANLTSGEYEEYKRWVAIGPGGLPHTLQGYRTLQLLNKQLENPLDVTTLAKEIGAGHDIITLKKLPKRSGVRPTIAPFAIPHRQTNQHNTNEIREKQKKVFDETVKAYTSQVHFQKSYFERHSESVFLKDSSAGNPVIMPMTHGEVAHIHPTDGSMHMILSPSDCKEAIEKGWGELHGLAGKQLQGREGLVSTYTMIYSPRTERELVVTKQLLEAAIKYAAHVPGK